MYHHYSKGDGMNRLTGMRGIMVVSALLLGISGGAMAQTPKAGKDTAATTAAGAKHLKPQTLCPIMGGPVDRNLFVDYNGKRIYVCCEGCLAQVKSDPEGAIKKLAATGQEPETIASAKTGKAATAKAAVKDTSVKSMDMSKDPSMKGMDHGRR
jgi:hypothetical protein